MLFTTSRKPSKNTRVFAKRIASLVPESEYFPRGKRGIEDLVEEARFKGYSKACIITDKQGNPHLLRFMKISKKNWNWAKEIKIKGVFVPKQKATASSIKTTKEFEEMFGIKSDDEVKLELTRQKNSIVFKKGEKTLLKINLQE